MRLLVLLPLHWNKKYLKDSKSNYLKKIITLITSIYFAGYYYCEISGNSRFSGYNDVHPEAYYKLDVQC